MKATTVFLARVSDGKGNFPFQPIEIKKGRPVAPENATSYYARYSGVRPNGSTGRIVTPLGSNLDEAYVSFLNLEAANKARRSGLEVSPAIFPQGKSSLADGITEYLENSASIGNDEDTLGAKDRTLHSFQQVAAANGVVTIEALKDPKIGKRVLLAYLGWMRKHLATQKTEGTRPENTYHKRMSVLGAFLKQQGIQIKKAVNAGPADTGLLDHSEFPKYKGRKATKYSKTTIQGLLAAANVDESDLIQFFLFTGFRDEEVAYAEWSDVNFSDRSINVHAKPQTATRPWTWKPKDDESRAVDIPLSADFVNRLKARQKRYAAAKCNLIFPSGACKPDNNLLRRIRAVAKRANVTQPVTLHKFRRTFGSYIAKAYGIEMARQCLGHSDIATTQLYLSADGDDSQEVRDTIGNVQAEYLGASA